MDEQRLAEHVVGHMIDNDAFSAWLGIELVELKPGYAKLTMTVRPDMVNGFGVAHGGIVFSFADSAMAFAANGYGNVAVALNNHIQYPLAVVPGDELTCSAIERSRTRRTAVYDVEIERGEGEVVALFRGTVFRTHKQHDVTQTSAAE